MKKLIAANTHIVKSIIQPSIEIETSHTLVCLSIFKKQIKNEKPRQHNLFYSAFNITPSKDKLLISKPSVFADLGLPSPKPGTRSLSFDDHFSPLIDKELPQLDIILDLIEKDENKEIILKAIGPDYLKNETSLIFEHNNEKITAIWETHNEDIWITPELNSFCSIDQTFYEFIVCAIEAKAFTRSTAHGKIIQDKRTTKDPHYLVMLDGNKLLIQRKRSNPKVKMDRQFLRQFKRVYPSHSIQNIEECGPIIAGLLSPEAGAFKDSGVAQTIFEKIPKLFISNS